MSDRHTLSPEEAWLAARALRAVRGDHLREGERLKLGDPLFLYEAMGALADKLEAES